MELSILDFCLVNFVSYIFGLASGLVFCLKNKDKLLIKSRSVDNLSLQQMNRNPHYINPIMEPSSLNASHLPQPSVPVLASAPVLASVPENKTPIKITVE